MMTTKPKISVIIPVYNVEEYIEKCICSLIAQTIKEIEFLVINDGSTDNSINLIKSFQDSRIRIINQKNSGLSEARNTGIKKARGRYVLFLDGDDYLIDDESILNMYNIAEKYKVDVLVGNAVKIYDDGKYEEFYRDSQIFIERSMSSIEFLKTFILKDSMQIPVWMNLYRKDFLVNNNLYFKKGILHEDELFTPQVFLKAKNIGIYPKSFYGYIQRSGSIMSSSKNKSKKIQDMFYILHELLDLYSEIEDKELSDLLMKRIIWHIQNIINTSKINKIPYEFKKVMIRNSIGVKNLILNSLLFINVNLYRKVLILFKKI